jgi:quercetin dioxygenase-like cupin family protein
VTDRIGRSTLFSVSRTQRHAGSRSSAEKGGNCHANAKPYPTDCLEPRRGRGPWVPRRSGHGHGQQPDYGGRVVVIEHLAPKGAGSLLHIHTREDEWLDVIDGELAFWVDGRKIAAPAGSFVYEPRGIPHTFTVTSSQARFLVVVEPTGFENFMPGSPSPRRPAHFRRRPSDRPMEDACKPLGRSMVSRSSGLASPSCRLGKEIRGWNTPDRSVRSGYGDKTKRRSAGSPRFTSQLSKPFAWALRQISVVNSS